MPCHWKRNVRLSKGGSIGVQSDEYMLIEKGRGWFTHSQNLLHLYHRVQEVISLLHRSLKDEIWDQLIKTELTVVASCSVNVSDFIDLELLTLESILVPCSGSSLVSVVRLRWSPTTVYWEAEFFRVHICCSWRGPSMDVMPFPSRRFARIILSTATSSTRINRRWNRTKRSVERDRSNCWTQIKTAGISL